MSAWPWNGKGKGAYSAPEAQYGWQAGRFHGGFVPRKLCIHFTAHGWCRKEDACTFAHGQHELDLWAQGKGSKGGYQHYAQGHNRWEDDSGRQDIRGYATTYHEELYTTKLDRSTLRPEDVAKAERIAQDIKTGLQGGGTQEFRKTQKKGKEDETEPAMPPWNGDASYHLEIYTTKLDPTAIPREKREEADRIAKEIATSRRTFIIGRPGGRSGSKRPQ